MPRKHAQITEEKTAKMYEDVLDRLGSRNEETSKRLDGKTSKQQSRPGVKSSTKKAAEQPRLKRTFYLRHAAVLAIEKLQSSEFEMTGKKPELSEIVERAIQALAKQSNI